MPPALRRLLALAAVLLWPALASASVGFATVEAEGARGGRFPVAVWYPTDAEARDAPLGPFVQRVAPGAPVAGRGLPLVLISHGTRGSLASHYDTALALAAAGFVVAAPEHPGDNWRDNSRAGAILDRPADLLRAAVAVLGAWEGRAALDPGRVGAFGFSAGGFAVLVAAGGSPDLRLVASLCAERPAAFECGVRRVPEEPPPPAPADAPRLRALVVAAPALGYTLAAPGGLDAVRQPVQLWRADEDRVLPPPLHADAVRRALPTEPEFHAVAEAGHFDFLAPCSDALARAVPAICQSRPGYDRAAFHARFNAEVVRFFEANLGPRPAAER